MEPNANCKISFYLTPRNVDYGWANMGVYRFKLSKENVVVNYNERSFNSKKKRKFASEYIFVSKEFKQDRITNSLEPTDVKVLGIPKILIVLCDNDTIKIDSGYTAQYKEDLYSCSEQVKALLHDLMPKDMKENWLFNISISDLENPDIIKIPVN